MGSVNLKIKWRNWIHRTDVEPLGVNGCNYFVSLAQREISVGDKMQRFIVGFLAQYFHCGLFSSPLFIA